MIRASILPILVSLTAAAVGQSLNDSPAEAGGGAPELPPGMQRYLEQVRPALPSMANAAAEFHGDRDLKDEPGTVSFNEFEAKTPFFAHRFGGTLLSFGLDWTMVDLEVDRPGDRFSSNLHSLYLPVSFFHRTEGSDWFWLGQATPGMRTDFNADSGDALAFRTFFSAMKQWTDSFALGFGAYYSYDPSGHFAAPGIGFTWVPSDAWTVALIPPQLTVTYEWGEDWLVAGVVRPRSFNAALDSGSGRNDPDYAEVSYGRANLALKRRLLPKPDLWVSLFGGYSLYSDLQLERGGRSLVDGDMDNTWFIGAALELNDW